MYPNLTPNHKIFFAIFPQNRSIYREELADCEKVGGGTNKESQNIHHWWEMDNLY